MNFDNKPYTLKRTYLGNKYYSCKKYKVYKCPARLIVRQNGTVVIKNEHTCENDDNYIKIDVREEMKTFIERECIKDFSILPTTIWENAVKEMIKVHENNPISMLGKSYAINHIKYIRGNAHGTDDYRKIKKIPICNVSENDTRKFLQFNMFLSHNNSAVRIVGFGHPDLIRLLCYPSISLFIDGTFKVGIAHFNQSLILMSINFIDLYSLIFHF